MCVRTPGWPNRFAGIYLDGVDGHDPVEDTAGISDVVHGEVVEALWRAELSTTWPQCPAHPDTHPLQVAVVERVVVWVCPRAPRTPVHRVGALPAPS